MSFSKELMIVSVWSACISSRQDKKSNTFLNATILFTLDVQHNGSKDQSNVHDVNGLWVKQSSVSTELFKLSLIHI